MPKDNIRVRRRFDGQGISGLVDFLAPMGLFVRHDPDNFGTPKLIPADGVRGLSLMRDVVAKETLASQLILDASFPAGAPVMNPDLKDTHCSASKLIEAEVEGPGLVLASGTGLIDETTAADTALSFKQGRHYVAQSGDETVGYLRAHLDPIDPDNTTRILVEYVQ